jgi:hypothetical protein
VCEACEQLRAELEVYKQGAFAYRMERNDYAIRYLNLLAVNAERRSTQRSVTGARVSPLRRALRRVAARFRRPIPYPSLRRILWGLTDWNC